MVSSLPPHLPLVILPVRLLARMVDSAGVVAGRCSAMMSFAGSLNSLNQDISSRPVPHVSDPSAPSSLPTNAPHSYHQQNPYGGQHQQPSPFNHMASASSSTPLRGASTSPLDALRVGSSSYSSMCGCVSSHTSSLGALGDELSMGMGRRTGGHARVLLLSESARSSSGQSRNLKRSGVDDGSSSPEHAYAAPASTSAYPYGNESLANTAPAPDIALLRTVC
ncbi:hypothetical protein DL93DRAFT_858046 [Clavulina sp. PMI_390]|nr:hypothetical protein DL93DRAFT_858046 [Clavulina sp. PMI_390]